MVTEDKIREVLNEIIDPCSARTGVPAGLVDMGLIREIEIVEGEAGLRVRVALTVTELGCFMIMPFAQAVEEKVYGLHNVENVDVTVKADPAWSENRLSDSYRQALEHTRSRRRSVRSQSLIDGTAGKA